MPQGLLKRVWKYPISKKKERIKASRAAYMWQKNTPEAEGLH
jgi:hypothetical protein